MGVNEFCQEQVGSELCMTAESTQSLHEFEVITFDIGMESFMQLALWNGPNTWERTFCKFPSMAFK